MRTNDTRLVGDVETYATDYHTLDFKVEYACGTGNNTHRLVFMPLLKTNRNAFIQSGSMYTTVAGAILSMVNDMNKAQRNVNNFHAEQLTNYSGE
jgi:hypothetical protein